MNFNNISNHESVQLLTKTIEKIDDAYSPATIRAYRVDFGEFIKFCDGLEKSALPAHPHSVVDFIIKLTNSGRLSASITGISSFLKLNRFNDSTKNPDVILEMRRMHRKLGRTSH